MSDATLLPAPGEPDACYLLDLSGWTRGVYEVAKPLPGSNTVARAVVSKLVNLLIDHRPAFLAVAADTPGPTWQTELWPRYKAGRVDPGPDYEDHIAMILRVLAAHRIPVLRIAGYEADDLLAAAVRRARQCGLRVVVISRDHDLWQLIDEAGEVIVWDGEAPTAIGVPEVRARYGIGPERLGELMALAGDGDEAPGIARVGEKTAARLLAKRGSLEEVLRKWSWERGTLAAHLRDGAADARLSRELVRLRDDAPIAFDLAAMAVGWSADDAVEIKALGEELGIGWMRGVEVAAFPKPPVPAAMLAAAGALPPEAPAAASPPEEPSEHKVNTMIQEIPASPKATSGAQGDLFARWS